MRPSRGSGCSCAFCRPSPRLRRVRGRISRPRTSSRRRDRSLRRPILRISDGRRRSGLSPSSPAGPAALTRSLRLRESSAWMSSSSARPPTRASPMMRPSGCFRRSSGFRPCGMSISSAAAAGRCRFSRGKRPRRCGARALSSARQGLSIP